VFFAIRDEEEVEGMVKTEEGGNSAFEVESSHSRIWSG